MADLTVIKQKQTMLVRTVPQADWATQTARSFASAAETSNQQSAQSAAASEASNQQAGEKLAQATIQADRAASYAGGSLTIAHAHTTLPRIIEPEYSRASSAFDFLLKRWEYNERRWGPNGTLVEESCPNILTTGSENFVTGWSNGAGETCTVTDYPVYIPELGRTVMAKRITGNGLGSGTAKYLYSISGRPNPHTDACSVYGMVITGNAKITQDSVSYPAEFTASMQRLTSAGVMYSTATSLIFRTNAATDILDVVVYAPQIENKPYATTYFPPGQTRAADSFALPVNAYQKNLLTLNQATGGDTLGDTTGFTAVNGGMLTRDTTEKWNGTGSIKVVTPGTVVKEGINFTSSVLTAGKIYILSGYAWGSGTIQVYANSVGTNSIVLTSTKQRISLIIFPTITQEYAIRIWTTGIESATFYIDALQLEEGTAASDWTLPAVDYTNALINPTAFSIEFDFVPTSDDKSATKYLMGLGTDSNNQINVQAISSSGYYCVVHKYNSGTTRVVASTTVCTLGVKAGHKISVSDGQFIYTLNGVDVGAGTFDGLPSLLNAYLYLVAYYNGTLQRNGYVSNVRIRNTSLTSAERAYTGLLTPDQYTTYCSECKESISSRPYVKDAAGQAQSIITASDPIRERGFINGGFELADRGTSFSNPATGTKTLNGVAVEYNGTGQTFVVSQQAATPGQMDVPGAKNFLRYYQSVAPTGQTTNQINLPIEKLRELSGQKCMVDLYLRSPEAVTLPMIYIYQYFGSGGSTSVAVASIASVKTKTNMSRYTFQVTMPSVAGKTINAGACIYARIQLPLNSAFTIDIADFDIYPGTFPRPMPRPTLASLQRDSAQYLQKLPANLQLRAVNIQANYIDFESVMLPTEMRAVPALSGTYAETANWKVLVNNAQTTGFSLALLNASANQIAFRATKTAHGLTDATLQLVTNVLLSAEL